MSNSTMQLLNPLTPLAFMEPEVAQFFEATRYIVVGTLGMYIWDMLTNLKGEYRLLTKYRIGYPTVAYFLARISAFSFVFTSAIFSTAPVGDCTKIQLAQTISFSVSLTSTAFLFFLRVRAVFCERRVTTIFFAFMWLATAACSVTIPVGVSAGNIGTTRFCTRTKVKPYGVLAIIMSTVYDTLVLAFISIRLLQITSLQRTFTGRVKTFFSPTELPAFPRALLQNGQQYYLIAVGINVVAMGVILAPKSIPFIAHDLFTVPNAALSNAMACRVHRDIKLGSMQDPSLMYTTHILVDPDSGNGAWNTSTSSDSNITSHSSQKLANPEFGYPSQRSSSSTKRASLSVERETNSIITMQSFVSAAGNDRSVIDPS